MKMQPPPKANHHPHSVDLVQSDLTERKQLGIKRYGMALQPHNGRDMLWDTYEELLDACVYIRSLIFERDGQ